MFVYLDYLQGIDINTAYIKTSMHYYVHLKFVDKMLADYKIDCSSTELVCEMWRLYYFKLLQWFISVGSQVYVLVPSMIYELFVNAWT
jgi:hypothetical protein